MKKHPILTSIIILIVCYLLLVIILVPKPPKTITNTTIVGRQLYLINTSAMYYSSLHNDSYGYFNDGDCHTSQTNASSSFINDTGSSSIKTILDTPDITASSTRCFANGNSFAVAAKINPAGNWYCVDSSGKSENIGINKPSFSSQKLCP